MTTSRKKLKIKDGLDVSNDSTFDGNVDVSGTINTNLSSGYVVANPDGSLDSVTPPATSYEHNQTAATNVWSITHNLGFHPNVTVVDSAGTAVETEIWYTDINTLEVRLSSTMSGKAYLS